MTRANYNKTWVPAPGDFVLCSKALNTGDNGDLICGIVLRQEGPVETGRTVLENTSPDFTKDETNKATSDLLDRNFHAHKHEYLAVLEDGANAADMKLDARAAARDYAVEIWKDTKDKEFTPPR